MSPDGVDRIKEEDVNEDHQVEEDQDEAKRIREKLSPLPPPPSSVAAAAAAAAAAAKMLSKPPETDLKSMEKLINGLNQQSKQIIEEKVESNS